jgi:hypothetical protein
MTINRSGAVVSASFLAGLALAVGLSAVVAGAGARLMGLEREDLDLSALAEQTDELDLQHARQLEEYTFANHLATRLAAGALTLADATAQMEPILRERPDFEFVCQYHYQVQDTRLGAARYLIDKVEFLLKDEPSRWRPVSIRLNADYAALR